MALSEETKVDQIEILADGQIQVREATVIYRDGEEISRTFHRRVLDPGAQDGDQEVTDPRVKAIKDAIWTKEVVTKRRAELEQETRRRANNMRRD